MKVDRLEKQVNESGWRKQNVNESGWRKENVKESEWSEKYVNESGNLFEDTQRGKRSRKTRKKEGGNVKAKKNKKTTTKLQQTGK